jgi:hypothetical protein
LNAIQVIHPFKRGGMWVFTDETVGLVHEPFIAGADLIIDQMVQKIPNADQGFNLIFSAAPFPGYQLELEWQRQDYDGNWYYSKALNREGWLCPALFKYFEKAPQKIYAQFQKKNS